MKYLFMLMLAMGLVASTLAEGIAWRVSAGGRMRFGIDSSLRLSGRAGVAALVPTLGSTQVAEYDKTAVGNLATGGKMEFADGSFIAKDEVGGTTTWNWQMNDLQSHLGADGTALEFRSDPFLVGDPIINETPLWDGVDDEWTAGATVELTHILWQNDRFGVDVSLGFSWFDDVNILKSSGQVLNYSTMMGHYQTDISLSPALQDEITAATATLGDATFIGPGPTITLPTTGSALMTSTTTSQLWINARGEMSMLEAQLAVQPYWLVWDRLYLRGKVGVALIASDVSIEGSISKGGTGTLWSGSEDECDITFAGILGLSVCYYLTDNLFIQGGVELLLGAEDTEIGSDFAQGSIGVGDFGATLALGWAF